MFVYFDLNSRHLCHMNKYKKRYIFERLERPDLCKKFLQFTSTRAFAVVSHSINRDCF